MVRNLSDPGRDLLLSGCWMCPLGTLVWIHVSSLVNQSQGSILFVWTWWPLSPTIKYGQSNGSRIIETNRLFWNDMDTADCQSQLIVLFLLFLSCSSLWLALVGTNMPVLFLCFPDELDLVAGSRQLLSAFSFLFSPSDLHTDYITDVGFVCPSLNHQQQVFRQSSIWGNCSI